MAALLQKVLGIVIVPILDWIYSKISGVIAKAKANSEAKAEIEKANREAREKTEQAHTAKEREDAAKNLINRF